MSSRPINCARLLLAFAVILVFPPRTILAQSTHRLLVARVGGAPLTEQDADDILTGATVLLRMRDTPSDTKPPDVVTLVSLCTEKRPARSTVPGCVEDEPSRLVRSDRVAAQGAIVEIAGSGLLANAKAYALLAKTPGYIKVVKDITWCPNTLPLGPGTILRGCGFSRPQYFAVVRIPERPALEAALWAHEYAHTKGVPHRAPPETGALMNPLVESRNRIVNVDECAAILFPHAPGPNARTDASFRRYKCGTGVSSPAGSVANFQAHESQHVEKP